MPPGTGADSAALAVVAFGGNALQRSGESGTVHEMRRNLHRALPGLKPLLTRGTSVVVTHGNGPQVGNQLLRSAAAEHEVPRHPVDIAVATTQGEIGSLIATELAAVLAEWGVQRKVATLVTHVVVDADDPALGAPTKPIGPFYGAGEVEQLRRETGWTMVEDAGRGFRRVVGSPDPIDVLEIEAVRSLVASGTVVVAAGGGGIPVARNDDGTVTGIEAVIDKDRTAALLAAELGADELVILTAVDGLYADFGTDAQRRIDSLTVADAEALLAKGTLPAGSMAPKVEAAARFARETWHAALITSADALAAALAGESGTWIRPTD